MPPARGAREPPRRGVSAGGWRRCARECTLPRRRRKKPFEFPIRCRAGVEGTLSQGVRAFGLRRSRYRGLEKTHLQHVATAAAINIDRIVAWLEERPRATTRTSRFAALAPVHDLPSETPSV